MKELHKRTEAPESGGCDSRHLFVPSRSHGLFPSISGERTIRETITYDCPELEPILEPTYGCIVYQEQVMQILRALADYSYGRADNVRRAMSKKKKDVMEAERVTFIEGCTEKRNQRTYCKRYF